MPSTSRATMAISMPSTAPPAPSSGSSHSRAGRRPVRSSQMAGSTWPTSRAPSSPSIRPQAMACGDRRRNERTGNVIGSFDPFSNAPANQGANSIVVGPIGHLYVSQVEPNQIAEFDADGTLVRVYGGAEFPAEQP